MHRWWRIQSSVISMWYGSRGVLFYLLWPLQWLYRLVLWVKKALYRLGIFSVYRASVPVIVVGNVTVGGVGKTPLVGAVVKKLQDAGRNPGVVARGYGGAAESWPQVVEAVSDPFMVGDEPVMLAQQLGCPVVVAPKRAHAVAVCEQMGCDVIVADDGLGHMAMGRDYEIAVVDGRRRFGNGQCLPAGPLREPLFRLRQVDSVIYRDPLSELHPNFRCEPDKFVSLADSSDEELLSCFDGSKVHAVAGIGDNERFFSSLRSLGCEVIVHSFPDHHRYSADDIIFADSLPVVMTEKDAVKCRDFCGDGYWFLSMRVIVADSFFTGALGVGLGL